MTDEERKYWLGFSAFPGIGPLRFKLLLKFFKSAELAWKADMKTLLDIGLGEKLTQKFDHFRKTFLLDDYISDIKKKDIRIVTIADKEYPFLLSQISDAPFLIYVRGDLTVLNDPPAGGQPRIGVVGTRKITGYGEEATRKITQGLVSAGVTIVSGMAYGVDAVAHKTAVDSGGKTIAVLGCGVDIIHPRANTTLYWQIVKKYGAVISEFPIGMYADVGLFPARNRIISGLSLGIVVTEGAEDSGALITARYAAEQGREVFAVPGPITSSLSKGPLNLLKQGAKLVTDAEDILEELKINPKSKILISKQIQNPNFQNLNREEKIILELLQNESLHFDEIVKKSGISASQLGSLLTMMEMKKIIKDSGGGVYGITSS
ncbi:DNA-protecting protein DprA [Candidatus Gottesmanbacteria bacterium]|nr:DNA-protecting protein DprA [Candidatus Gottesmanbacteria bacterium]